MGKKDDDRETWGGKLDFLLSCIGYAVGLGNVWRFPYLCYRNGGGAFLIPYVIMLAIAGMPLFFMELSLGQFASEGPITVWKVSPFFMGAGWAMVAISAMVCIYYNVIIMYAIYYMFVAFVNLDEEVPWIDCDNSWNTEFCRQEAFPDFDSMSSDALKVNASLSIKDTMCVEDKLPSVYKWATGMNMSLASTIYDLNYTTVSTNFSDCNIKYKTPSEEFFTRYVLRLHEADGLEDVGDISLKNVLCLLVAWLVIFFCLMKGIKSSGKVVYFTATFPYAVLIVLLIRGVTLPGCIEGIKFYIIPKWELLLNPKVWGDAATQIFYSLGPAFGGLLTMASYNKFKNNCFRDAMIVPIVNCGTSVFAGFAIFSLLGFMAHQTNQAVEDVADSGPGLAFVAYPEGIARLPVSSLWALLFFFMLFTLGLDSQFAMMETVISGLTDLFPHVLRHRKALFTFLCCAIGFCLGIPQTTRGGILILTLFDWYCASYNLMLVSFFEIVAIMWVYGFNNFIKDIQMMIGKKHPLFFVYWIPMWVVVTPLSIVFIVVMSAVYYSPAYYGDYTLPPWAQAIGWIMVCIPLALILLGFIVQTVRHKGIRAAMRPQRTWGPRLEEHRVERYSAVNYAYEIDDGEFTDISKEKNGLGMGQHTNSPYPIVQVQDQHTNGPYQTQHF